MGTTKASPRTEFIHYTSQGILEGLRQDHWKLLVKKPRQPRNRKKNAAATTKPPEIMLFDLSKDMGEQNNLAETHPELVTKLKTRMEELDAEITTNARAPWTTE